METREIVNVPIDQSSDKNEFFAQVRETSGFAEAFTALDQFRFFRQLPQVRHKQFDENGGKEAHNGHEPEQPSDTNEIDETR